MQKMLFPIVMIILIIGSGCEKIDNPGFDNPLDPNPDNPDYVEPAVTPIEFPADGTILNTHTVTFKVHLNETASAYQYQINESWSNWLTDTTFNLVYLDEGDYSLHLKARNIAGIEGSTILATTFTIDAVKGPALRFYPRYVSVQSNSNLSVEVIAEEVSNLSGLTVEITQNTNLELVSYQVFNDPDDRSFLGKDASLLYVPEVGENNSMIRVDFSRVGQPAAVSGTGSLMELTLHYKGSANTELNLSPNCMMLDSAMQAITIRELVTLEIIKK